jgi:hypothetical protein
VPLGDLFSFLEDPTAVIVMAAVLLLIISTVRDGRQYRRRASRLREHLLTNKVMHFRSNEQIGHTWVRKAR